MDFSSPVWQTRATLIGLCVAIGIGLLIGAERERRKTSTQDRSAAGIRTFTVAALLGAVGALVGGVALVGVAVLLVGMVVGIVREWRDSFRGGPIEATLMGAIIGLCVSGGGVLLVAGVWFGAKLLLA